MNDREENLHRLGTLIRNQRWAALATLDETGEPSASMVAYVIDPKSGDLLLHLSGLAAHSGNLLRHPGASLVISENDSGEGDPQLLARATLKVEAQVLEKESKSYSAAQAHYLGQLPDAEQLFSFGDFQLFRLDVLQVRFVGGFARAYRFEPSAYRQALAIE